MAWYLRKIHFNFCGKFELNSLFSCYNCIQPGLLILRMIAIAGPFSVPSCLLHYCQPLLLRSRLSRALYIMGYLHCFCQPICQKMGWQQQAIFKVKHSDCMFELSRFALQKNSNSCARALSFFCLQYLGSITLFFYWFAHIFSRQPTYTIIMASHGGSQPKANTQKGLRSC